MESIDPVILRIPELAWLIPVGVVDEILQDPIKVKFEESELEIAIALFELLNKFPNITPEFDCEIIKVGTAGATPCILPVIDKLFNR